MSNQYQHPTHAVETAPAAIANNNGNAPSKCDIPFFDGFPEVDGYYLVELDQPGLSSPKPYDVDYCRAKSPSDGGGREWINWCAYYVLRWAFLPTAPITPDQNNNE